VVTLGAVVTFGTVVTLVWTAKVNSVLGKIQNWKHDDRLLADLIGAPTAAPSFVAWP